MDRQRALETLERLERRRRDARLGLWLAPPASLIAQALLLAVLADERIGWLARVAVLAAALATALAAIWSVLRSHAREVQYSEAIAALGDELEEPFADLRPTALARPRRRRTATAPEPAGDDGEAEASASGDGEDAAAEAETKVVPPAPPTPPASTAPPPPSLAAELEQAEDWVARWDRHLVWWASGPSHAKPYMAWTATLALFALADVAVFLSAL